MKEKIHTIPINEAFQSGDECPFCYLERQAEQRAIDYTLGPGASYMEPEVRAVTDREGFCGAHLKKLYDYGNALGSALILQTYCTGLIRELERELDDFELPAKRPLFRKNRKQEEESDLIQWMRQKQSSCFVCGKISDNMTRYYKTFFMMLRDAEFCALVESSKGFCMRHFLSLLEEAQTELPNARREWFYRTAASLMRENLARVKGDLDWFVAKNDFRNAGLDWKNSRDALSRTMQKLQGLHPSDPPFKSADFGTRK